VHRTLFCLDSDSISGGIKVCREMMQLLVDDGQEVEYLIWNWRRKFSGWNEIPLNRVDSIEDIAAKNFDYVVFSNAYLVPMFLPFIGDAHAVLYYMAHESFHYGLTYTECMAESEPFLNILRLPISIVTNSEALRNLLKKQAGRDSYYVPVGPDKSVFYPRPPADHGAIRKRILLVGDYNLAWKGMKDALEAVEMLSHDMNVELVLLTQGRHGRKIFDDCRFPVEIKYQPPLADIPEIYASCHVYCCSSWHEGLGLAALEAFSCGVPAVCTKNHGVDDYGIDNESVLLAEPNNPQDIYGKLKAVLSDQPLSMRLRENAFKRVERYEPSKTLHAWKSAQQDILKQPVSRVNSDEMQQLLVALEADGMFTPLSTYDTLQRLNGAIDTVCDDILNKRVEPHVGVEKLSSIKDEIKQYTGNTDTQYFKSFKSGYDLCQLLIAFKDTPDFLKCVSSLSGRNK
jgi:glycosyltransferase involved in cell wall biosynthesis